MTVALANVTGSAQTGLTSPAFTILADQPPNASTGKQWNISAYTGTGNLPRVHAISDPFTILFERPGVLKALTLALLNAVTGIYGKVPDNVYRVFTRKGVNIAANNLPRVAFVDCRISVPAGAEAYNPVDVRGMLSLFIGAITQVSAGLGDTTVSGTL